MNRDHPQREAAASRLFFAGSGAARRPGGRYAFGARPGILRPAGGGESRRRAFDAPWVERGALQPDGRESRQRAFAFDAPRAGRGALRKRRRQTAVGGILCASPAGQTIVKRTAAGVPRRERHCRNNYCRRNRCAFPAGRISPGRPYAPGGASKDGKRLSGGGKRGILALKCRCPAGERTFCRRREIGEQGGRGHGLDQTLSF